MIQLSHLLAVHLRSARYQLAVLHLRVIQPSHPLVAHRRIRLFLSQILLLAPRPHLQAVVLVIQPSHLAAHLPHLAQAHLAQAAHRSQVPVVLHLVHLLLQALVIRPFPPHALHLAAVHIAVVLLAVQAALAHRRVALAVAHSLHLLAHPAIQLSHPHVRVQALASRLVVHLHSRVLAPQYHSHPVALVALAIRHLAHPVLAHRAFRVAVARHSAQALLVQAHSLQAPRALAVRRVALAHPLRSQAVAHRSPVAHPAPALLAHAALHSRRVPALLAQAVAVLSLLRVRHSRPQVVLSQAVLLRQVSQAQAHSRRRVVLSQAVVLPQVNRVRVPLVAHHLLSQAHRPHPSHRRRAVFHHQAALSHPHLHSAQAVVLAHLSLHLQAALSQVVHRRSQVLLLHSPAPAPAYLPALRSPVHHSQAQAVLSQAVALHSVVLRSAAHPLHSAPAHPVLNHSHLRVLVSPAHQNPVVHLRVQFHQAHPVLLEPGKPILLMILLAGNVSLTAVTTRPLSVGKLPDQE